MLLSDRGVLDVGGMVRLLHLLPRRRRWARVRPLPATKGKPAGTDSVVAFSVPTLRQR